MNYRIMSKHFLAAVLVILCALPQLSEAALTNSCYDRIRLGTTPSSWAPAASVQAAYTAVNDLEYIELVGMTFIEDLVFDIAKSFTLTGGYACDYLSMSDLSDINGSLTVAGGAVVIDKIVIDGCPSGFGHCSIVESGCQTNIATDLNNCGGCGLICSIVNGTGACVGGVCTLGSCNAGFFDIDGLANTGCEVTFPAAPGALVATEISGTQIDLSWADNSDNETGFRIERGTDGINFLPIGTVGENITAFSDNSLSPVTKSYYRVSAYNAAGNSTYSNTANGTTWCTADIQCADTKVCTTDVCDTVMHRCTNTPLPVNTDCGTYTDGGYTYYYGCDLVGECILWSVVYSCPMLYTWNGQDFAFESDMYPSGYLGLKLGSGYRKPDPYDTYLLAQPLVADNGRLNLRIVEELDEIDYLDEVRLFAIDIPENRSLVAWANKGSGYIAPDQRLVTVDSVRRIPVSAVRPAIGSDISTELSASDSSTVVLSEDMNAPYWNTIEVDFGDLTGSSVIKLIVDGRSRFPTTAAGKLWQQTNNPSGQATKIEVLDSNGNWVEVPKNVATLVKPKEFPRPMAIDITNIFLTNNYRVRLSWFYKTSLDAIWVDTTPNLPVTVTEAPIAKAELRRHGFSGYTGGDLRTYQYSQPGPSGWPLGPGSYTKYGEVTSLLGLTDDKFVIFGAGDEVVMDFQNIPTPPATGYRRLYAFQSSGYYKENIPNPEVPFTVSPLPFLGMSNFPYQATEQYPADESHQSYLSLWNTRTAP